MSDDGKQGIRAFLALSTPAHTKASLEELRLRCGPFLKSARFVPPERVHLTLHFFASLLPSETGAVDFASKAVTDGMEPFDLKPGGVGVFPGPGRPRVLWVGIRDGERDLLKLAAGIGRALEGVGLSMENRSFKPHVTVARLRDPRQPRLAEALEAGDQIDFEPLTVDRVVLFQSRLGIEGPRYTTIGEYPLRSPGAP